MATITIQLPSVLSPVVKGRLSFTVEAESLGGAFAAISRAHPEVALHLFDETGNLRRHVLCFHNQTNTRWLDDADPATRDGDTLLFMQAVSGG